jgi:peptidoglycan/LPS O-acetylase OafA/YrhL
MPLITKLVRLLLIITCAAEGIFFLVLAYVWFDIDRGFNSQWFPWNLRRNVFSFTLGLLFAIAAYLVLKKRILAQYLSGFLFIFLICWVFRDVFFETPRNLGILNWSLVPVLGLVFVIMLWNDNNVWHRRSIA